MPEPKFWDEDTHSPTHGPGIADVALTTPSANEIELRDALNSALAALRSAGIIAQD
ncbi:hypothetical protein [Amycolatopsis palatopharyngis]|uniref:hypothetical protein n=1 Tax=Amycolatopsis palatopharyngis TaxID=187982 RepID=UPI0013BE95AB|nr:hypothetical protein [Amycolatopsis palatopharyngis]